MWCTGVLRENGCESAMEAATLSRPLHLVARLTSRLALLASNPLYSHVALAGCKSGDSFVMLLYCILCIQTRSPRPTMYMTMYITMYVLVSGSVRSAPLTSVKISPQT